MSDRAEFEKRNPVPENAVWCEKKQGYYWSNYPTVAHPVNNDWEVWQEALEYARAQSEQGVEVAADFRAEIRTERDPSDEYVSYLTLIVDGKSHPYLHIPESLDQSVLDEALRRLNSQPQPAQPEADGGGVRSHLEQNLRIGRQRIGPWVLI